MNTLEEDKLQELIRILQQAHKHGFALSTSSVIEPLLETLIDLSLNVGYLLSEGTLSQRTNPGIKELSSRDELGNPKMIKVFKERNLIWDPKAGDFILHQLVPFLTRVRRGMDFETAFAAINKSLPNWPLKPVIKNLRSHKRERSEAQISRKEINAAKRQRRKAYYHRQNLKKSTS